MRDYVILELGNVVLAWLNQSGGSFVQNSGSFTATLSSDSMGAMTLFEAEELLSVMLRHVLRTGDTSEEV